MKFDGILDRSLNRVRYHLFFLPFPYILINIRSSGIYALGNNMDHMVVEKSIINLSSNPAHYPRRARKRTYSGKGREDSP